jgi:hypothetical protein
MALSFSSVASSLGTTIGKLFLWGGIILVALCILMLILFWLGGKAKWNLKVEFKIPRSDGKLLTSEHGKGAFNASKGYCLLKRAGVRGKKYEIKNFDPTKFLQGTDTLTVIQVGANEFRPVVPDSFYTITDYATGQPHALMSIKGYTGEDIAWQQGARRNLRDTFTIKSLLSQYANFIGWGFLLIVVILGNFIGFGMVLDRIKG